MKSRDAAALVRLGALAGVAVAGLLCAVLFGWRDVEQSLWYMLTASGLLCFGLYMAVYGIDRDEARRHLPIVLVAVTFGVLCKYLLIFLSAYFATGDWRYAVLGMAVAQIDPLSVAAMQNDERMSPRAKTVLGMWAAFDDPMTALATPVILGLAAKIAQQQLAAGTSWGEVLLGLVPFAAMLLLVGLLAYRRRMRGGEPSWLRLQLERSEVGQTVLALAALLAAMLLRLYSAAALAGWLIRPKWLGEGRRADQLVNVALYGATFMLGLLLAEGVDWKGGMVLGAATYGSQVVVAWLVVGGSMLVGGSEDRRFSARDTWHLAISQQNGITAIVLSLNLEPVIDGAVAAVSLAIVVTNLLHFAVNSAFDRFVEPRLQG